MSPTPPLAFRLAHRAKEEMKKFPGFDEPKRGRDQEIRMMAIVRAPKKEDMKNPDFIRSGKIPFAHILNIALKDPIELQRLVEMGLPLKNYPKLARLVIERGNSAKNLEQTLNILKKGGAKIGAKEIQIGAAHLTSTNFIKLLQNTDGLKSQTSIHNLALTLANKPTLSREVLKSGVMGSSTTVLAANIASLKQPATSNKMIEEIRHGQKGLDDLDKKIDHTHPSKHSSDSSSGSNAGSDSGSSRKYQEPAPDHSMGPSM